MNVRHVFSKPEICSITLTEKGLPMRVGKEVAGCVYGARRYMEKLLEHEKGADSREIISNHSYMADLVGIDRREKRENEVYKSLIRGEIPSSDINVVEGSMIISTEPPYYDRADYANLSDFFYVWLRYVLKDIYPDLFVTITTPKDEELITASYRFHGDKDAAKTRYIHGLRQAVINMESAASTTYPSNIAYFYKRNHLIENAPEKYVPNEWDEMIAIIADAGFVVTASWPVGRTVEMDICKAERKGIPITIIVRKKDAGAGQTTRRRFVVTLKRELPAIIEDLKSRDIADSDLRMCALGPAWNVFTRYDKVIDADGSRMSSYSASYLIEQELDACLSDIYRQKCDTEKEEG
jgi:putative DNA methylase